MWVALVIVVPLALAALVEIGGASSSGFSFPPVEPSRKKAHLTGLSDAGIRDSGSNRGALT